MEKETEILFQQIGLSEDYIIHNEVGTLDPKSAELHHQFGTTTNSLPVFDDFNLIGSLEKAEFEKRNEDILHPLVGKIGNFSIDYTSLYNSESSKYKLSRDFDIVYNFETGNVCGLDQVISRIGNSDESWSLDRRIDSKNSAVTGSCANFPFLPGGFEKKSERKIINKKMNNNNNNNNNNKDLDDDNNNNNKEFEIYSKIFDNNNNNNNNLDNNNNNNLDDNNNFDLIYKKKIDSTVINSHVINNNNNNSDNCSLSLPLIKIFIYSKVEDLSVFVENTFKIDDSDYSIDLNGDFRVKKKKNENWVVADRISDIGRKWKDLVPVPAIVYDFEMDDFQKEATYHLERGDSVFVAAHTSAGKTVIAEYAISLSIKHGTRSIYTSPIKALSNQKYRDFSETFGNCIGLITGDIAVHSDASSLVVTTEILRSMLYKGADIIRDLEWVIFDEIHYINDEERGVVWEETIIMLPDHIGIVFLSATVSNIMEFAEWVGRVKRKKIYVITTDKRPVPLDHHLYHSSKLYKVFDSNGFHPSAYADIRNKFNGKKAIIRNRDAFECSNWQKFVLFLIKNDLTPAVAFVFSRRKCLNLASKLKLDLTTGTEKHAISVVIEKSLNILQPHDRDLPQILFMRKLLSSGIAIHNSGILPILKELVEILFGMGLIKVLFATETFAMGINMPARTVIFNSISKYDSGGVRTLQTGEYIQMSGRAGRRNIDTVGTVIIMVHNSLIDEDVLKKLLTGDSTSLTSKFKLNYQMILNLIKFGTDFEVGDMMKMSFLESRNQYRLEDHRKVLKVLSKKSNELHNELEGNCLDEDCIGYAKALFDCFKCLKKLQNWIFSSFHINNIFKVGRVLLIKNKTSNELKYGVVLTIPAHKDGGLFSTENPGKKVIRVLRLNDAHVSNPVERMTIVEVAVGSSDINFISDLVLKTRIDLDRIDFPYGNEDYLSGLINELDDVRIDYMDRIHPPLLKYEQMNIREFSFYELLESAKELLKIKNERYKDSIKKVDIIKYLLICMIENRISDIREILSERNLVLIEKFRSLFMVLRKLDYINDEGFFQLKGRVARELNNCNELLATEIIFENTIKSLGPAKILALFSCLVGDRNNENVDLPPELVALEGILKKAARKIVEVQKECGINVCESEYFELNINTSAMEAVYKWGLMHPFDEIMKFTQLSEGIIVRVIMRLDETFRNLKNAAIVMGDTELTEIFIEVSQIIKRDIIFVSSLYITESKDSNADILVQMADSEEGDENVNIDYDNDKISGDQNENYDIHRNQYEEI